MLGADQGSSARYSTCMPSKAWVEEATASATVRELPTLSSGDFAATLAIMQESTSAGGLVRRAATRHLGKSEREAAGVLSSAQRHTHFIDSARINQTMARSPARPAASSRWR
jgi:type IV secretory pathway TraG/TraD family ATPase VirD4